MRPLFFFLLLFLNTVCMAQKKKIKRPGVYVKEVSRLPSSIAEVETAIPAFIGYTEKATKQNAGDLFFVPQRINSMTEFENYFGFSANSGDFVLYASMKIYFANGGGNCYVISVGNYNEPIQRDAFFKGLTAAGQQDELTLLVFPDAAYLPGNDLYEVQKAALRQAEDLGDRFCIFDLKFADNKTRHDKVVQEFRDNIGMQNLKFGAAYTPYLVPTSNSTAAVPPSGAIAGVYCSVDKSRGVWKAPANVSLSMVNSLTYAIGESEQAALNVDAVAGKSINSVRVFSGKGIMVWGARTLAGNDNEWRYVPVRRFFTTAEESITKSAQPFVFEPNDANTWVRIKAMIENYLTLKWRAGALQGSKPEHAFFLKTGLGETMTQSDINNKKILIEYGMAAVRPAEFIVTRIVLKMAN